MITNFKITNCYAFNKTVEFSMKADMRTKKFYTNVYQSKNNINVLKLATLYGPNNTGKTAFINCIKVMRDILLNKKAHIQKNLFEKSDICEMKISFLQNEKEYQYEYKYDYIKEEYIYEKFSELKDEKEDIYYIKDTKNNVYECNKDERLQNILSIASRSNILIYTIETKEFDVLEKVKNILITFASKIDIVDMNHIPNNKTIEFLKNKNDMTKKVVEFIKKADLYLDDYSYEDKVHFGIKTNDEKTTEMLNEKLMKNQSFMEQIKIVSYYKGKPLPSILFDSVGTRKIAALASYVIDAIQNERILIVDELDSSLHFKITRAIIGLFNNEKNIKGQLICTLHDICLLDCKRMFRKEQIYFTAKDEKQTYLYSLKGFTYYKNGIRADTSDILEKYEKGIFGAIPEPDLISVLIEEEK